MAAERSATETAADRLYRNTEQSAWNTYTNATLTTRTSCIGSIKTPENTYKTAVDTAESAFDTTTVTALSSLKHSSKNSTYLHCSTAGKPTVLTAYSRERSRKLAQPRTSNGKQDEWKIRDKLDIMYLAFVHLAIINELLRKIK